MVAAFAPHATITASDNLHHRIAWESPRGRSLSRLPSTALALTMTSSYHTTLHNQHGMTLSDLRVDVVFLELYLIVLLLFL